MFSAYSPTRLWLTAFALFLFSLGALTRALAVDVPRVILLTPSTGQVITGPTIPVRFSLSNFKLTDFDLASKPIPGQGHIHLWLDQTSFPKTSAIKIASDQYLLENTRYGSHTLRAELVNNDHSSLNPPVVLSATFTSAPPSPATNPKNVLQLSLVVFILLAAAFYLVSKEIYPTPHPKSPSKKSRSK